MQFVAFVALMAFCMVSTEASPFGTMTPAKIRHVMKKTYCEEMSGQRVYYQEQLETDCSEKVQFFGENVRSILYRTIFKIKAWLQMIAIFNCTKKFIERLAKGSMLQYIR